jgi:hypothetical protein
MNVAGADQLFTRTTRSLKPNQLIQISLLQPIVLLSKWVLTINHAMNVGNEYFVSAKNTPISFCLKIAH